MHHCTQVLWSAQKMIEKVSNKLSRFHFGFITTNQNGCRAFGLTQPVETFSSRWSGRIRTKCSTKVTLSTKNWFLSNNGVASKNLCRRPRTSSRSGAHGATKGNKFDSSSRKFRQEMSTKCRHEISTHRKSFQRQHLLSTPNEDYDITGTRFRVQVNKKLKQDFEKLNLRKLAFDGKVLGLPQNMMLASKVVKIDSKIIISLC